MLKTDDGFEASATVEKSGVFITFEGIDGSGKSTQLCLLVEHLRSRGHRVRATREPGGTRVGEQIRDILLATKTQELVPLAELALMYAARAQHLEEVVRPALARGEIVVSDRFNDASLAYQGFGRRLGREPVRAFDRVVCGATQPHLTLVLDLDPRVALSRARRRDRKGNSRHERFEKEDLTFHQQVRRGYLALARLNAARVKLIQGDRPVDEIQAEIRSRVDRFLESRAGRLRRPNRPRRAAGAKPLRSSFQIYKKI